MTLVLIQPEVQSPNIDSSWGTSATLRIYASTPFYSSENVFVQAGRVGTTDWCQTVDCTIEDNVLTIGACELYSTTDSSVPNATYTAGFFDSSGRRRTTKLDQFSVDPNGLQVQAQSSVLISGAGGQPNTLVLGAGTTAANGLYTRRGLFNSRPYYNLQGSANSTTVSAIIWNTASWVINAASGSGIYRNAFVDKPFPYTSPQTWGAIGAGSNPVPTVTELTDNTCNGLYTYRSTLNGKGVYALSGLADESTVSYIAWDGSTWVIYSNTGLALYTSSDAVDFPWEVTTWVASAGLTPLPTATESTATVATTWEAITISQQGPSINFFNSPPTWSVDQIKGYVQQTIANGANAFASQSVAGNTFLDVDPVSSSHPIAVGINSPTIALVDSFQAQIDSLNTLKAPKANPIFTGTIDGESEVLTNSLNVGTTIVAGGNISGANLSGTNTGDQTSFNGGTPSAVVDTIQFRRGTAAAWTSANPTLASGEEGLETDTNRIKIGDGTSHWNTLTYLVGATTLTGNVTGTGSGTIATTIANLAVTDAMLAGSISAGKLAGSIPASKLVQSDIVLTESQITNLTSDLALKANLISPSFTTPSLGTVNSGVITACTTATQANQDSSTKIANTAFVQGLGTGCKVYEATLTQVGTGAPTAQVLNNTLGMSLNWARTSAGLYSATAASGTPFTLNKTQVFVGNCYVKPLVHDIIIHTTRTSTTVITLQVTETGVADIDDTLLETAILIKVFP